MDAKDLDHVVKAGIPLIKRAAPFKGRQATRESVEDDERARGAEARIIVAVAAFVGYLYDAGALNRAGLTGGAVALVIAHRSPNFAVGRDGILYFYDVEKCALGSVPDRYAAIERVDAVFRTLAEEMQGMIDKGRVAARQDLTNAITLLQAHAETLRAAYE